MQLEYRTYMRRGYPGMKPLGNFDKVDMMSANVIGSYGTFTAEGSLTINPAIARDGDLLVIKVRTDLGYEVNLEYPLPENFSNDLPGVGAEIASILATHPGLSGFAKVTPGANGNFTVESTTCPPCTPEFSIFTCGGDKCTDGECREQWASLTWDVTQTPNPVVNCIRYGYAVVQGPCYNKKLCQISSPINTDPSEFIGFAMRVDDRTNEHYDLSTSKYGGGNCPQPYRDGDCVKTMLKGDILLAPVNPSNKCEVSGNDLESRIHYATPAATGYEPGQISIGPLDGFVPVPVEHTIRGVYENGELIHVWFNRANQFAAL